MINLKQRMGLPGCALTLYWQHACLYIYHADSEKNRDNIEVLNKILTLFTLIYNKVSVRNFLRSGSKVTYTMVLFFLVTKRTLWVIWDLLGHPVFRFQTVYQMFTSLNVYRRFCSENNSIKMTSVSLSAFKFQTFINHVNNGGFLTSGPYRLDYIFRSSRSDMRSLVTKYRKHPSFYHLDICSMDLLR